MLIVVVLLGAASFVEGLLMFLRPRAYEEWIRRRGFDRWSFLALDAKGTTTQARGALLLFIGAVAIAASLTESVVGR